MKKKTFLILLIMSFSFLLTSNVYAEEKAIWQDPGNVVLLWDYDENYEYKIFRSTSSDGEFECIGYSENASFRDNTVVYPNMYYYKVEKFDLNSREMNSSEPFVPIVSPTDISAVNVIMYHNFVSDEDVKNGVEFEEYSITPQDFEQDLIWLKNNGYITITSDDLIQHLEGKKTIPYKAVIISIDDGSWGVYKNAWPLLKKYNMKADFNIIGAQIDATWEELDSGETRIGNSAPFCTWEEIVDMSESGEINICSHTYGLHVYDKEKRVGMSMMQGETAEDFSDVVEKDYKLSVKCIEGWTGKVPETVAYPYSKRSSESDRIILNNTGYKILMAGEGARGTVGNYFVKDCDFSNQMTLMSRPCRMDGSPIEIYLERIVEKDGQNGVNKPVEYIFAKNTDEIAKDYQIFDDVNIDVWFSGSVYYSYLNGLMRGVSERDFAPNGEISRAMAATLLNRLAGNLSAQSDLEFSDGNGSEWWFNTAKWAVENNILPFCENNSFKPDNSISRQELAQAMYNCGELMNLDMSKRANIEKFLDAKTISVEYKEAVSWAVDSGIFNGNADGTFNPTGNVTRAEMSMILRNWLNR